MFARSLRPAARSLRVATAAPRAAPSVARSIRFKSSEAGPNQGATAPTGGSSDGAQLLMVLGAGAALAVALSITEKQRKDRTAPNPDSKKGEEEIEEEDEVQDADEGQPEEGPSEYAGAGGASLAQRDERPRRGFNHSQRVRRRRRSSWRVSGSRSPGLGSRRRRLRNRNSETLSHDPGGGGWRCSADASDPWRLGHVGPLLSDRAAAVAVSTPISSPGLVCMTPCLVVGDDVTVAVLHYHHAHRPSSPHCDLCRRFNARSFLAPLGTRSELR